MVAVPATEVARVRLPVVGFGKRLKLVCATSGTAGAAGRAKQLTVTSLVALQVPFE